LAPVKGGATFEEEVIENTKNRMFNDPCLMTLTDFGEFLIK